MHVCDTWSFSAISRVVLWRSESIIVLIRSSSTSTEIRNYLVANPIIKYTNKSVFYLYVYLYISWGGGSWSCVSCVISSCNFTWRERRRSPWSPSWRIFHWHETTRGGGGGHESATRCLKLKLRSPFPSSPRDASLETQRSGRGWPWFRAGSIEGRGASLVEASRPRDYAKSSRDIFSPRPFKSFDSTLFEG